MIVVGYYLGLKIDNEWIEPEIGGKFFGYLDNDEFESCYSYQFIKNKVYDADLLNVWWSCFEFNLSCQDAIKFLALYEKDYRRIKDNTWIGCKGLMFMLHLVPDKTITFSMG